MLVACASSYLGRSIWLSPGADLSAGSPSNARRKVFACIVELSDASICYPHGGSKSGIYRHDVSLIIGPVHSPDDLLVLGQCDCLIDIE